MSKNSNLVTIDKDKTDNSIKSLIKDLELTRIEYMACVRTAIRKTKTAFYKKAVDYIAPKIDIKKKELKRRIRLWLPSNTSLRIFGGLYKLSVSRWKARKIKKGIRYAGKWKKLSEHSFFMFNGYWGNKKKGMPVMKGDGYKVIPSKGRYAGRRITRGPKKGQMLAREYLEKQFDTDFGSMLENMLLQFSRDYLYDIYMKILDKELKECKEKLIKSSNK